MTKEEEAEKASKPKGIPPPIQTFLWRQTDPFLRKKIGKLYEVSCVSFEHVLVENKLRGLPPSLSGAIESITRWQLIDACLPHVMQCAALLLMNRDKLGQADKLGVPATKLLLTLHWIFLESTKICKSPGVPCTISHENARIFIYLFAPVVNNIKESDLTFRLSSGQQIWRSMWKQEQPNIPSFVANIIPPGGDCHHAVDPTRTSCSSDRPNLKSLRVTVCDVAVINCLLYYRWPEDGILWGITYLLKKLQSSIKNKQDDASRVRHRRCRSLINRKTTLRNSKTMKILPPQTESSKEDAKSLEDNEDDNSVTEDEQDLSISSGKMPALKKFQRQTSEQGILKRGTPFMSPITKNKNKLRNFASQSVRRFSMSSKYLKKHVAFRKRFQAMTSDEPPPYDFVKSTSTSPYSRHQSNRKKSQSDVVGSSSHPVFSDQKKNPKRVSIASHLPPGYNSLICKNTEDEIQILYSCGPETMQTTGECSRTEENAEETFSQSPLTKNRRWTSDTCLTYIPPEEGNVTMTSCKYVDGDGNLREDAILSIVDVIIDKNPGVRVTDVCVQVLNCLLQMKSAARSEPVEMTSAASKKDESQEENKTMGMFLKTLHGLVRILGCPSGCGKSGHRNKASDRMRSTTRSMMTSLLSTHGKVFEDYVRGVVQSHPLSATLDFLHPLISFCSVDINSIVVNEISDETLRVHAESVNAFEDKLVKLTFGKLVQKCIKQRHELHKDKNKDLYNEMRNLVQFVRLKHPSTFNQVLLHVMLIPRMKRDKWEKEQKTKLKQDRVRSQTFSSRCKRGQRRGAVDFSSSPIASTKIGGKSPGSARPTSSFMKRGMDYLSDRGTPMVETSFLFPKSSKCAQDFLEDEEMSMSKQSEERSGSIFSRLNFSELFKRSGPKQTYLDDDSLDCGETSGCEHSETFLTRIMRRRVFRDHSSDTGTIASKITFVPFIEMQTPEMNAKTDFEVDSEDLYNGLKILEFLMDCCPPGTVPEPSILRSVMGLTSPVISRAVVLLQCAQFVDRCAAGCWPHWMMEQSRQSQRFYVNAKFYVNAGKLFKSWGEALSTYLDKVILFSNKPSIVLGEINPDDKSKPRKNEEINEDFLKDIHVNESGRGCPIALQMAASDLLYQITNFLRDVFPQLPLYERTGGKEQCPESSSSASLHVPSGKVLDSPSKRTQKTFDRSEVPRISLSFSSVSSTRRVSIAQNDDAKPHPSRQSSYSINSAVQDEKHSIPQTTGDHAFPLGHSSSNTLAVPSSDVHSGGVFSPSSSCEGISYGSTLSLSASSVISEYPCKDPGNSAASITYMTASPGPSKEELSSWTEDLPWLKVILRLANHQNFICDHAGSCHPFCYKRRDRSCDRLIQGICNSLSVQDESDFTEIQDEVNTRGIQLTKYLKTRGTGFTRMPFSVLLKSATLLSEDMLTDLHTLCWEILLNTNKANTEAAACLFLLCAIKMPEEIHTCIMAELGHTNPAHRIRALRKIRILWENRNLVWKNAEHKARKSFRTQVPNTNLTLSPTSLGLGQSVLPDPPWVPHIINIDEILAQSGSSIQSSAIFATDTLSHYKEKEMKNLLRREKEERAIARRTFRLTGVPVIQQITCELRKKMNDDVEEETSSTARRLSWRVSNVGTSFVSNIDQKKEETKNQTRSILGSRLHHVDGSSQENVSRTTEHHAPPNFAVFPPCIAGCVPAILQSTLDVAATKRGLSVGDAARYVTMSCLTEDTGLFLRNIVDKLMNRDETAFAAFVLRELPLILNEVGLNVAHAVFNQLVETVLHYYRMSRCREKILAPCIFAISSILPFANAVELKTLKQSLRKEQIDLQLLVTSGMPGTKKLTIWNQDYYMPNQFEVSDRSNFKSVLQEVVSFYSIPANEQSQYQLIDRQNDDILCPHCHVRDLYIFRKAECPTLALVKMAPEEGIRLLARRVVDHKLVDIGKLQLSIAALQSHCNPVDKELNAAFVLEELKKLWSFPRKAMDAEFFLFETEYGKEVRGLDVIQKYYWVELIYFTLLSLSREYPWETTFVFFMHVWSGALVVHCEHASLLRRFSAAVIDLVVHFSHSFTLNGYDLILPTMLRIYSKHYSNKTIRNCLELVFSKMLKVHREPFLLQLFASAAPLLTEYGSQASAGKPGIEDQVSNSNYFQLLLALLNPAVIDHLHVMDLVQAEKPLKVADVCVDTSDTSVTFGSYFRLCVTVIAYQTESTRTLEMLIIMNSILPCYFEHIKTMSESEELSQISDLTVTILSLLSSVEMLTRSINSTTQQAQQQSQLQFIQRAQSDVSTNIQHAERKMEEGRAVEEDASEQCQSAEEFVAPRDVLLQLCTTFYRNASNRLIKHRPDQPDDVFNTKSHVRLAEVAHSLLKLLTDESVPTVSIGLACYVKYVLPIVDWSVEATRPALFIVLKRLDRFFGKISKVYSFRRGLDWRRVSMIVGGLCDLLARQPAIAHVPHLRTFVNMSATMQVGSNYLKTYSGDPAVSCQCNLKTNISPILTPLVTKIMILQSKGAGEGLREILGPLLKSEKIENLYLNLIIPICLCSCTESLANNKHTRCARQAKLDVELSKNDVNYLTELCLNSLLLGKNPARPEDRLTPLLQAMSPAVLFRNHALRQAVLFLTLKIIIACFHDQLQGEWTSLARKIKVFALKNENGSALCSFMLFVLRYRTPLLVHLKPFVVRQFVNRLKDEGPEARFKDELGYVLAVGSHKFMQLSSMIGEFVAEARNLRQQLQSDKGELTPLTTRGCFMAPKSPNASKEALKERSRIGSFRQAMSPMEEASSRNESRAGSPATISRGDSRRTSIQTKSPSLNTHWRQLSKKSIKGSSFEDIGLIPTSKATGKSIGRSEQMPIPNIKVDAYESPLSSRTNKSLKVKNINKENDELELRRTKSNDSVESSINSINIILQPLEIV
ncbi:unnamed protein product [Clavelina lepadiformis]|uniref:Protein unc-80 homolog n=2 Tax=Clavelina lepadiformis TaxID=159417 RepID=A0ABP0FHV6_CLALP